MTGVGSGVVICVLGSGVGCGLACLSPGVGAWWSAGSPPAVGTWSGLDELAGSPLEMGAWSGGGDGGKAASSSVLCSFTGVDGVAGVMSCRGGAWVSSSSLSDDGYAVG